MFYRTDDGQGTVHINFGRKGGPQPCHAAALPGDNLASSDRCYRMSSKLCDAPVGKDLSGKILTCDMPLCKQHATHVGHDLDYCPRHKDLAKSV